MLRQVGSRVDRIVAASAAERAGEPQWQDVELDLADGTRLTGTVQVRGDLLLTVTILAVSAAYLYAAIGRVYAGHPALRSAQAVALALSMGCIVLGYRFALFLITLYST